MNLWIVVILASVQGITEFLPISSSAHLTLLPWIFGFSNPGLAFDAAIHIGTALALLVFFGKEFFAMIQKRDKLVGYILVASLPAAIIGFVGDSMIEKYLHMSSNAPLIIGIGLIFFSLVLLLVDRRAKLEKGIEKLTLSQALLVGFAQAIALIPGTSRSGVTITAGLWLGLKREDAARFSFLLATPISLGAGLYKLIGLIRNPDPSLGVWPVIVGIIVAFLVGIVVIKWLLDYLKSHSMPVFVIYRIILGIGVIALWTIRR